MVGEKNVVLNIIVNHKKVLIPNNYPYICLQLIWRSSMEIEAKLTSMGIKLPTTPDPIANYVTATQVGDLIFLSGTTCYKDGALLYKGRVGNELTLDEGYQAAWQTMLNLLSVLKSKIGELDRVKQIVKINGYVNSTLEFDRQPEVINGASDLLVQIFGEKGKHARTSIGTSILPGQIPVEIEMIVQVQL